MTSKFRLEDIHIASPCPSSWDAMYGDDMVRYCNVCAKNVYNISAMTRSDAEVLLHKMQGGICARIFLRKDGSVMTSDCPVGLARLRKLIAKRIAAVAALVFGLFSGISVFVANHALAGAIREPVNPAPGWKSALLPLPPQPPQPPLPPFLRSPTVGVVVSFVQPVLIYKEDPRHLPECDTSGRGIAIWKMHINESGIPSELSVMRSHCASHDKCIRKALMNWRYKPAMQNGQPVSATLMITVRFEARGFAAL